MKHLVIIGAGGMGRSVCFNAKGSVGYGETFDIKGFIDDDIHALDGFNGYPPLLGTILDYQIEDGDVFACSMGNVQTKRRVCEYLRAKGAQFFTLIHKTAIVGDNAIIGDGCVIGNYAIISPDIKIGVNTMVQDFAIVGHDCVVGDYVRIDTHCTCVGGTVICDGATIHTNTVINHKVTVGENAIVGAVSFVIRNVKAGTTVSGNPARKLDF